MEGPEKGGAPGGGKKKRSFSCRLFTHNYKYTDLPSLSLSLSLSSLSQPVSPALLSQKKGIPRQRETINHLCRMVEGKRVQLGLKLLNVLAARKQRNDRRRWEELPHRAGP